MPLLHEPIKTCKLSIFYAFSPSCMSLSARTEIHGNSLSPDAEPTKPILKVPRVPAEEINRRNRLTSAEQPRPTQRDTRVRFSDEAETNSSEIQAKLSNVEHNLK